MELCEYMKCVVDWKRLCYLNGWILYIKHISISSINFNCVVMLLLLLLCLSKSMRFISSVCYFLCLFSFWVSYLPFQLKFWRNETNAFFVRNSNQSHLNKTKQQQWKKKRIISSKIRNRFWNIVCLQMNALKC